MTTSSILQPHGLPPGAPAEDPSPQLVVDYPAPEGVLFANVRTISGWAWTPEGPLDHIRLRIDGGPLIEGRLGYPRLDAVDHGVPMDDALRAGFRFEFEPADLSPGEHGFAFMAGAADQAFTHAIPVRSSHITEAPIHVADVFIDIVGFCNLRCAMCPHGELEGIKQDRPKTIMPPGVLDRILTHLGEAGCLTGTVNLYNWGDPLLHPELDEMLAVCAAHGQGVILSSNLAMGHRFLDRLFRGRTDLLMVSISGMTQETYGRNHRGGSIARVLDNLHVVAQRREAVGSVLLKYLVFDYNESEIELARDFADRHGLQFGAYRGAIPSMESRLAQIQGRPYAAVASEFVGEQFRDARAGHACPQESNIIVDPFGNLDACAMSWGHAFGAAATAADLRDYLINKMDNPTCRACQRVGYSHYRHYEVIDPELIKLTYAARGG